MRISRDDIEKRFYDIFASWDRADREAALKVLATVHRHLPDAGKRRESRRPETSAPAVNGAPQQAATLLDGQDPVEAETR